MSEFIKSQERNLFQQIGKYFHENVSRKYVDNGNPISASTLIKMEFLTWCTKTR